MTTFTLDNDKNITAHDATPAALDNVVAFATEKELTKLSADWPITRFVEVWNAVQDAVDAWIKQGGLQRLTDEEARRIADEIEF